jgi:hypothetical protein
MFRLEGVLLSNQELINDTVKLVLAIGLLWLLHRNISVTSNIKGFPKIEFVIGILYVVSQFIFDYLHVTGIISYQLGSVILRFYVFILRWSIPILLTARALNLKYDNISY